MRTRRTTDRAAAPAPAAQPVDLTQWQKPAPSRYTGLPNLGNTCYMAALLQLLTNIPVIRQTFDMITLPPDSVGTALQRALQCGKNGQRRLLRCVRDRLRPRHRTLQHYRRCEQQDPSEVLIKILDTIRVDSSGPARSQLDGLFQIVLSASSNCMRSRCSWTSATPEAHDYLFLPVDDRTGTLRNALQNKLSLELVEANCQGCGSRCYRRTQRGVVAAGDIILLAVGRKSRGRRRRKDRCSVTLDATLQVLDGVVYHFVGAIIHLGDYMDSGHYVTVVKCADGLLRYFNDDDQPEILTWSNVNERFHRDAYVVAYQRGPTSVAPIAAPGRGPPRRTPTLTQWGHEEDTDEEEVSDLEEDYASSGDESESEDEAPPAPAPKQAPKRRREAPEPAPPRSRRRTEPTDDAPDARPPKQRGETAGRRSRTTRRGPPADDDDGLSNEEPEPKRPLKRRRAKASSGRGGEDDSDDGDESYRGGDTSGDDSSDEDSDDGYDGPELTGGRVKDLFRHTKGPYRDIERLLKDKEAWHRYRRHNSSLKDGFFTVFPKKWRPGDPLPDIMRDAWEEHGHPLENDPESLEYLKDFAEICYDAKVRMPLPGEGFTIRTYCKWLHAWAAKRSKRRRAALRRAAGRLARLLFTSSDSAREFARGRLPAKACWMCVDGIGFFLARRRANNPALKSLSAFGVAVNADSSAVNNNDRDARFHRDHLELSRFFRGQFCTFHNTGVVHQADERTTEGYTGFCARVHENARTYLDDTPPPSDGEGSSSGSD